MPAIVTPTVAVAAGARVNLLQGNSLEVLPYPAQLAFAVVAEAAGILVSVMSGSDVVQDEGPAIVVAANGMPRNPDDFYLSDVAGAGEKIAIWARNTTAGAVNVRSVTTIDRLA